MTWDREAVEVAMQRVGLDPAAFDLEQIAADLEARTAMSESLVALVGDGLPLQPPIVFDPRWSS